MSKDITVYLKTALFALPADDVPVGSLILGGELHEGVIESTEAGIMFNATQYRNDRGQPLDGKPCLMFVPFSKIDHVRSSKS